MTYTPPCLSLCPYLYGVNCNKQKPETLTHQNGAWLKLTIRSCCSLLLKVCVVCTQWALAVGW